MGLNQTQIDNYWRDGIVRRMPALEAQQALELGARYDEFAKLCVERLGEVHWFKTYLLSRWVFDIASHPRILDCVESILGPNLLVWGADMFYKPPSSERFTAMHQDSTYWGLEPADALVNVWVGLGPSTVENGCVRMIYGSHRNQQVEHDNRFDKNNVLVHGQTAVGYGLDEATPIELDAGEMSLFHLFMVHGSGANTTPKPRLGLALRYITPEVHQTGVRDSALLVRGEDTQGNFDHERPPQGEFDEAALAQFRDAIKRPSGSGNAYGMDGLDATRADAGQGRAFPEVG